MPIIGNLQSFLELVNSQQKVIFEFQRILKGHEELQGEDIEAIKVLVREELLKEINAVQNELDSYKEIFKEQSKQKDIEVQQKCEYIEELKKTLQQRDSQIREMNEYVE